MSNQADHYIDSIKSFKLLFVTIMKIKEDKRRSLIRYLKVMRI